MEKIAAHSVFASAHIMVDTAIKPPTKVDVFGFILQVSLLAHTSSSCFVNFHLYLAMSEFRYAFPCCEEPGWMLINTQNLIQTETLVVQFQVII